MSRILKRPMFRIGGSANDGIMSMAAPRKNYENGSDYDQQYKRNVSLLEKAAGTGRDLRNRQMDLLLEGSLNLLSGAGAGKGTIGALATSFKKPAEDFIKGSQAEETAQRQLRMAAATSAITSSDAERMARIKAQAEQQFMNQKLEQGEKELFIKSSGLGQKAIGVFETLKGLRNKGAQVTDMIIAAENNKPSLKEVLRVPKGTIFVDSNGRLYKKTDDQTGFITVTSEGTTPSVDTKPMAPTARFEQMLESSPLIQRKNKMLEEIRKKRLMAANTGG